MSHENPAKEYCPTESLKCGVQKSFQWIRERMVTFHLQQDLSCCTWVPLPSSEASGEYYRVGFNHVIQAIKKKKKGFNCLFLQLVIGIGSFGRNPSPDKPVIGYDKIPAGVSFLISPLSSQIIEGVQVYSLCKRLYFQMKKLYEKNPAFSFSFISGNYHYVRLRLAVSLPGNAQ